MAWSEDDERILEENYGRITAKEISEKYFPDKKPSSIIGKANRMGLSSDLSNKTKPMPEELEMSREEWQNLDSATRFYYRNRDEVKEKKYTLNKERKNERAQWLQRLKRDKGCQNCEESHPACLVFHHLHDKKDSVSNLLHKMVALDEIIVELEKCAVLCSNCHRKHHAGKKIKDLECLEINSTPE